MQNAYRYRRGARISVFLEAIGGSDADLDAVSAITAVLKRTDDGITAPVPATPPVATFDITRRPADGDIGPGWMLTIEPASSAEILPGAYVTNAHLFFDDGDLEITDALLLTIEEAA